jgi:hypothetical protein
MGVFSMHAFHLIGIRKFLIVGKKSLEPKTCFGHNKSISTQNQMKFKGCVSTVTRDTRIPVRATGLILLQISEKHVN